MLTMSNQKFWNVFLTLKGADPPPSLSSFEPLPSTEILFNVALWYTFEMDKKLSTSSTEENFGAPRVDSEEPLRNTHHSSHVLQKLWSALQKQMNNLSV